MAIAPFLLEYLYESVEYFVHTGQSQQSNTKDCSSGFHLVIQL